MDKDKAPSLSKTVGLILGPAAALIMLLIGAPDGLAWEGWATAALLVWMAVRLFRQMNP